MGATNRIKVTPRMAARIVLGIGLIFAGVAHLTFAREDFRAQVPAWLPLDTMFVIVASGVVEIVLGLALLFLIRGRVTLGWVVAVFFIAVFPGNISQFLTHSSAFGLDTDLSRGIRLLFQPLLVVWALWCTGAWPKRKSVA